MSSVRNSFFRLSRRV